MSFFYKHGQNILALLVLLLIIGAAIVIFHWESRDTLLQYIYEIRHKNEKVESKESIDRILDSYEKVNYSSLDEPYLEYTRSAKSKYKKMLNGREYFVIPREDIHRKIVGEFMIKQFMCKDKYYKEHAHKEILWLIDRKVLYKTIELLEALEKEGYDKYGFLIRNGHRHPTYNEKIKGAGSSRHIVGEAIDISVRDINQDGKVNKADKKIVYDLLNKKIIKNEGGIGRYPGTMSLHYDVRGNRARWDSY
ncbi:MAG: hypothetical protein ACI94Y_002201 [Maribacter sp.]|jgi:hypothetical protein